jgi:hypothetical protein
VTSEVSGIRPAPTDEEAAAIMAALEGAWPRAVVASAPPAPERWRWSGRWWSKPVPLRRRRPW